MYSDRRGNGQKPPRTKSFQTKDPLTKAPDKSPREQLRENLYRGLLSGLFVLGLLKKSGGSEMCDVLLGGPGCVTKGDRGRGSKLAQNSVTYFMNGPLFDTYMIGIKAIIIMIPLIPIGSLFNTYFVTILYLSGTYFI